MSKKLSEIIKIIEKNINLFYLFEKVYIFGSILNENKHSSDIDFLLMYRELSKELQNSIDKIEKYIEQESFYPVDITALSFEEEREIAFIDKLDTKYICIK